MKRDRQRQTETPETDGQTITFDWFCPDALRDGEAKPSFWSCRGCSAHRPMIDRSIGMHVSFKSASDFPDGGGVGGEKQDSSFRASGKFVASYLGFVLHTTQNPSDTSIQNTCTYTHLCNYACIHT